MIHSIDEALRLLLEDEVPRAGKDLVQKGFKVSFEPPSKLEEESKDLRINLYLHDVTENTKLRLDPYSVQRRPSENSATFKRSKVRVDLSYVVSAYGPDVASEHRLLTAALAAFVRNPMIPKQFLEAAQYETEAAITIAQPREGESSTSLADLWLSIGGRLRPSLALKVTAEFDPFETSDVKVVREMIIGLGFVTEEGEPGRPQQVKSHRVSTAGLVLNEQHAPLPGAVVAVVDRPETAVADDRGFFYITNLPSGPQRLTIHCRGYKTAEQRIEAPPPGKVNEVDSLIVSLKRLPDAEDASAEAALFSAPPGATVYDGERKYPPAVTGRLLLADGRPASYVPVRLGEQRSVTDLEGRYRFHSWVAGDTVWATFPGLGEVEVKVSGGAGSLSQTPSEERPKAKR